MTEKAHMLVRRAGRMSVSAYREAHEKRKSSRNRGGVKRGTSEVQSVQERGGHMHARREAPENPEVSARLTNLSMRHPGSRPAWFDFEPLPLPGRTRQCRQVFWQIMDDHSVPQKRMMALVADAGMGKSAFLAELHSMLENAPKTVMTLSPCVPGEQSFQAIRTILEQRFYISSGAPFECIEKYVRGAIGSIVAKEDTELVCAGILSLWRPDSGLPAGKSSASEAAKKGGTISGRPLPPPLETRITSVEEVLKSHEAEMKRLGRDFFATDWDSLLDECESADAGLAPTEATVVLPENRQMSADDDAHLVSDRDEIERRIDALREPMLRLFAADLKQNALVIVLDDVERMDRESLELLAHVWRFLPEDVRLTILMTSKDKTAVPAPLQACSVDFMELSALSDNDLAILTHHILKKLSETREKLIAPRDICNLIAQRSYGNPKHAIGLTLRHFSPDCMIHWNDAVEKLRQEPVPQRLCQNLARRLRDCSETKKIVLQLVSPLTIPFTVSTVECILTTWSDLVLTDSMSCAQVLKELRREGFLERVEDAFGSNAPTYVFKHEYERSLICGSLSKPIQRHVYCAAAQWYSLNNTTGIYDEAIGDLWRSYKFYHEACRYYERAAYRALNRSQLTKSWLLFRKLLKSLPEGNVSARIQFSLDGARVAFRTGQVDEAFRLSRRASHHAFKISANSQVARANIQMAMMLVEMGSVRHVERYLSRAAMLLNSERDPVILWEYYTTQASRCLFMSRYKEASAYLDKARAVADSEEGIRPERRLRLELLAAEIELYAGDPNRATALLSDIIHTSSHLGAERARAMAYRALGNLRNKQDNLSGALEAWNIALGIVQETNDAILHAQLLADIADGAMALEAHKTARNVTEQCLGLAQQTHQKALIARCLANTGFLQYAGGQYDRAFRTLRKAHRSAMALKSVSLWTRTLSIFAHLYLNKDSSRHNPEKAALIHRSLSGVFNRYCMAMDKAAYMVQHGRIFLSNGEREEACNAFRIARSIYIKKGLEKSGERIQSMIDTIVEEDRG